MVYRLAEHAGHRQRIQHPQCPGRGRSGGFTLLELLVTLAVAAILLGIAAPAFRGYVQTSRLTSESQTLIYSLNLARDEAVKLDTSVQVCASTDGATCAGTNAWANGWIVCYPAAACTTLLSVSPALSTNNQLDEVLNNATAVSYQSGGQTPMAYQFVFCDSRGVGSAQDVEVSQIGRIEASQTAGQNVAGTPLGAC